MTDKTIASVINNLTQKENFDIENMEGNRAEPEPSRQGSQADRQSAKKRVARGRDPMRGLTKKKRRQRSQVAHDEDIIYGSRESKKKKKMGGRRNSVEKIHRKRLQKGH